MARYQILHNQFCALAKETRFQKWLESISPQLYSELIEHLKTATGCKASTQKMQEIQQKLQVMDKATQLVNFLRENYPTTIIRLEDQKPKEEVGEILKGKSKSPTLFLTKIDNATVFKHYNPNLLTYPMKAVFMNEDVNALRRDVKKFMADKIDIDYIVIGNKAYVEYFKIKHEEEAKLVPKQRREIYQYRLKIQT